MIETGRLTLRPWHEGDRASFAALINTTTMMAALGGVQPPAVIDRMFARRLHDQATAGFCYWATEWRATGQLVGSCGLRLASNYGDVPVAGMHEIGWRVAADRWGQGIAREAAAASIAWCWRHTEAPRIGAWTTIANTRSWGLMERLGMARRPDLDFRHRDYAAGDPVGEMIVYVLERPQ